MMINSNANVQTRFKCFLVCFAIVQVIIEPLISIYRVFGLI